MAFAGWHLSVLLIYVVPFVLWLIAIIQVARSGAQPTPLALWILIVTLIPVIGPILYWAAGRRSLRESAEGGRAVGGR